MNVVNTSSFEIKIKCDINCYGHMLVYHFEWFRNF